MSTRGNAEQYDRWLNNAQAAADSANFMRNVKFDGIQEDITAPNTPWIYYGVSPSPVNAVIFLYDVQGSYAGARAAHMRILYPDITYGAIASSGKHTLQSLVFFF